MLEIRIVSILARKVRCEQCAWPSPPDLPAAIVQRERSEPAPMVKVGAVKLLRFDPKLAAAGREVGSDDD